MEIPVFKWLRYKLGNIEIPDKEKMLFFNFGQEDRAKEFLKQRLPQFPDDEIKSFDVPVDVLEKIRLEAVPMRDGRHLDNIHKPQIADKTKAPDQYGLREPQIKIVEDFAIPRTGQPIH